MKHLLLIILISFLLLSSPVIGNNHKGETLYGWGKYPNFVWKGFGDKETHPVYKGDVKNGKPHGLGILVEPDGGKYVGGWKDGKPNGQGTKTFSSGVGYEGGYKDGKRNGQGKLTYQNGKIIRFIGEWKNGEKSHGTITLITGGKYVGKLKNEKKWNGTEYDKDGNIISKFVNGEEEVKEKIGVVYIGIRNGKFGDYKEKWEGEESKDNRDIGKYEGELNKYGTPHGQGIFTTPYGEKHVGVFDRGDLWTGTIYDNEGNILFRKVKGWVQ